MKRDGLTLSLADTAVTATGANQQAGTLVTVSSHFRHIVRQIYSQFGVTAVLRQLRKPFLQMNDIVHHTINLLFCVVLSPVYFQNTIFFRNCQPFLCIGSMVG